MNIVFKGKNLPEHAALEDYTNEKIQKFFRHFKDIIKVEVELRTEVARKDKNDDFIVDINVKVPGHTFQITDSENDMYKAIDRAVKRMNEVLRREKERHSGRFRTHLGRIVQKIKIPRALRRFRRG